MGGEIDTVRLGKPPPTQGISIARSLGDLVLIRTTLTESNRLNTDPPLAKAGRWVYVTKKRSSIDSRRINSVAQPSGLAILYYVKIPTIVSICNPNASKLPEANSPQFQHRRGFRRQFFRWRVCAGGGGARLAPSHRRKGELNPGKEEASLGPVYRLAGLTSPAARWPIPRPAARSEGRKLRSVVD